MLPCAWNWGQAETIRGPYYQVIMTRTPDNDRAPNIGTGVFCVPFSGPGRFLRMLTATAKYLHHRPGSLARKGSLCCLWESMCHLACDSSILGHCAPPRQELLPGRTGLSGCTIPAYRAGCLCQGSAQPASAWGCAIQSRIDCLAI